MEDVNLLVKLITDNGIMVVMTAIAIVIFIKLIKKVGVVIERVEKKNNDLIDRLIEKDNIGEYVIKQNEINDNLLTLIKEVREGATKECTIDQIKTVIHDSLECARHTLIFEILRIKKENHLDDKGGIVNKVTEIVDQRVADRKNSLFCFYWKGRPLSMFPALDNNKSIVELVLKELYREDFDEERVGRDVEIFFESMRVALFRQIVNYNR